MNTFRMDIKDVLNEIEKFGFERVLDIPFMNCDGTKEEHLYGYFHYTYGIFLQFDSYGGNRVNGGHFYYQWKSNSGLTNHKSLSSGGWTEITGGYIWSGYGDCRTDMFENITALACDGKFITPWINLKSISAPTLVHYMDYHADYNAPWDVGYEMYKEALRTKTSERFKMLPPQVQKAINQRMRFQRK